MCCKTKYCRTWCIAFESLRLLKNRGVWCTRSKGHPLLYLYIIYWYPSLRFFWVPSPTHLTPRHRLIGQLCVVRGTVELFFLGTYTYTTESPTYWRIYKRPIFAQFTILLIIQIYRKINMIKSFPYTVTTKCSQDLRTIYCMSNTMPSLISTMSTKINERYKVFNEYQSCLYWGLSHLNI